MFWLNYNIIFINFTNNIFDLIYYITNYAIKKDTSQYQKIINIAFVKSAYDESQRSSNIISLNTNIDFMDKFALVTFNRLVKDQEISGFLITNLLLGLREYYIMSCNVKSINIRLLRSCFSKFAVSYFNQVKDVDNFVIL